MDTPALRCHAVSKRYGKLHALSDVNLDIHHGTIHAFVGQNGAGKSTLLGVLAGRVTPSEGRMELFGNPVALGNPRTARAHGIVAIYQELTVVPALSASANVFLGQTLSTRGLLREQAMHARFHALCDRLGVNINPLAEARTLSVADQQSLEIMRAMHAEARVILFDEPTSSLAPAERDALFKLMGELREQGVTMVFVSHNLEEVLSLADHVSVFRNGHLQASQPAVVWTKAELVRAMLGEDVVDLYARSAPVANETQAVLSAEHLNIPGVLRDVSLDVRPGEILGIGGLVGSGRTSLLRALAGLEPAASGTLRVSGHLVAWPRTPRRARALGVALVPEDRKLQGLVLGMSAMENIALGNLGAVARRGVINGRALRTRAGDVARGFGFQASRLADAVGTLSGGNQQKALLARWGFARPRVLLVDEPTRGIDIGAKRDILETLRDFARQGVAVVLVSSELEEIVALADRALVLSEGRVARQLHGNEVTVGNILSAAFHVEGPAASTGEAYAGIV